MRSSIFLLSLMAICIESSFVFIGTYQNSPGGIVIYDLKQNGTLEKLSTAPTSSPSFLALHPNKKFLYSCIETKTGSFQSWKIENSGGIPTLRALNSVSSNGDAPAHLSVHPNGKFLLGTNYNTGNYLVYEINSDGTLGKLIANTTPGVGSKGKVPNQNSPHSHQITTHSNGDIHGVDLGADKIFTFAMDQSGMISVKNSVSFPLGTGPRHSAYGDNGMVYVAGEYSNRIFAFKMDKESGELNLIQDISTLPTGFSGYSAAGEIRVHPNGKFLYVSNRGANNIAVFDISKDGKLISSGFVSSYGEYPRGMNLDSEGKWMILGNQNGNSITILEIGSDGKPFYRSQSYTSSPVDVLFFDFPSPPTSTSSSSSSSSTKSIVKSSSSSETQKQTVEITKSKSSSKSSTLRVSSSNELPSSPSSEPTSVPSSSESEENIDSSVSEVDTNSVESATSPRENSVEYSSAPTTTSSSSTDLFNLESSLDLLETSSSSSVDLVSISTDSPIITQVPTTSNQPTPTTQLRRCNACGSAPCCVSSAGDQCYSESIYTCGEDNKGKTLLCPKGTVACNGGCVNSSLYVCTNDGFRPK